MEALRIAADRSLFLREFLSAPAKVGSLTPSSAYLARKIFQTVDWAHTGSIVELGAGTGVFTAYIARHKRADCKAVIVEQDPVMRAALTERFPEMSFGGRAENLPFILKKYGIGKADCIVSGLPFAVIKRQLRVRILAAVRAALHEGGSFIAFQYTPQMYFAFRRHFARVDADYELRNFPPALVYQYRR